MSSLLSESYNTATNSEPDNRIENAQKFVISCLQSENVNSVLNYSFADKIKLSLNDAKSVEARDGALQICNLLIKNLGKKYEPYFILVLPDVINLFDDKVKLVAASAKECLNTFFDIINPYAAEFMLPFLFEGMSNISWKIKVGCLQLLGKLALVAPTQVGQLLPYIVPKVSENMWDTKIEVKLAAKDSLSECCTVIHNPDVKPIVPDLIEANANPKQNAAALDRLMATTFISQVERSTLAIIVPLLSRGLRDRDVQTKRKVCVVVDNMCKLVCDAKDVEPFKEKLLPDLIRVEEEVPVPEIRAYGARARKTLEKAIIDGGGTL
tara:strand:+ start:5013 stop:5984 length:972 start_codon:yes stop_codon:yes gene_type:complete